MNGKKLLAVGCLLAAMVVGLANPSGAAKPAPTIPLTPAGEKLLARYAGMLAELRAEIVKSLPQIDDRLKAAFLKAYAAEAVAKASATSAALSHWTPTGWTVNCGAHWRWNWPEAVDAKGRKGGSNPEVKKAQLKELLTNYGPVEFNCLDLNTPRTQEERGTTMVKDIKAYCLDFNWGARRRFAGPGSWRNADPAAHVAWYKAMGVNVIQTFCVSCNGYAWYKNGFVPEQPGLKHDFLTEVVKLGHKEGMLVMGYFCIAANTKWGMDHPDLSYGSPSTYHIPYTDEYLAYLSASISDAVRKTGIDGFMIDWLWQPKRQSTKGKWIECEKNLYQQLMGRKFPGEDKLTKQQDLAYSRKAIDRCWKAIRKTAKDAKANCIVWVTSNHMNHPHVVTSDITPVQDNPESQWVSIAPGMG